MGVFSLGFSNKEKIIYTLIGLTFITLLILILLFSQFLKVQKDEGVDDLINRTSTAEICNSLDLFPVECIITEDIAQVTINQKLEGDLEGVEFSFNDSGNVTLLTNKQASYQFPIFNFFSSLISFIVKPILFVLDFFGPHFYFSPAVQGFDFISFGIGEGDVVDVSAIVNGESCGFSKSPVLCSVEKKSNGGGGGGGGGGGSGGDDGGNTGGCGNGVLETGEECDDGNLVNGDGCNNNCFSEMSYCSETKIPLSERTGQGPQSSWQYIQDNFDRPANLGIVNNQWTAKIIKINGIDVVKITFNFVPFDKTDPDFLELFNPTNTNWDPNGNWDDAILYVPLDNTKTNLMVTSMNKGMVNSIPIGEDQLWGTNIPLWWKGTKSNDDFMSTYASIASDLKVPIVFKNTVPNPVEFTPTIQAKLKDINQKKSPTYTCDDNICDGILTGDGPINICLGGLGRINYPDSKYINFIGYSFYSVVSSRVIDASEYIMNNEPLLSNYNGKFKVDNFIVLGGSKRGAGTEKEVASDPRAVAGWVGHANAGNYFKMFEQRKSLYTSYPNDIYLDFDDQISWNSGKTEWQDRYDIAKWKPEVLAGKTYLRTWGGLDTYFETGSENLFKDVLPKNTIYLQGINYPHGGGLIDYAIAVRNLVGHISEGEELLNVDARWNLDNDLVRASVTGGNPNNVELWCTVGFTDKDIISLKSYYDCTNLDKSFKSNPPDLRYAEMAKENMVFNSSSGFWEASPSDIPVTGGDLFSKYRTCVVRANEGFNKVATSTNLENSNLCRESLFELNSNHDSVCGNGVLESGEQCDDGNLDNGDGCSDGCEEKIALTCDSPGMKDGYCDPLIGETVTTCPADCINDFNSLDFCPTAIPPNQVSLGPNKFVAKLDQYPANYDPTNYQVDSLIIEGVPMKLVSFSFGAFTNYMGSNWVGLAKVLIPDNNVDTSVLVIDGNTGTSTGSSIVISNLEEDPIYGLNYPSWFKGTDDVGAPLTNYEQSYGSISAHLNAPMVFYNIVPGHINFNNIPGLQQQIRDYEDADADDCNDYHACDGDLKGDITKDGDIRRCLDKAAIVTGKWEYEGFFDFAVAQKRLIDATQDVLNQYSSDNGAGLTFNFQNVFGVGSSKRGIAQKYFLVIDDRVKGVAEYASDLSNFKEFWESNRYSWDHVYWYDKNDGYDNNYHGPPSLDRALDSRLKEWSDSFDPFYWNPSILSGKEILIGVGSRDWNFPFGASLTYLSGLPSNTRMMFIPNYPHGHGSIDHINGYESLIRNTLDVNNDYPLVKAFWNWTDDSVNISVLDTNQQLKSVVLWCSTDVCLADGSNCYLANKRVQRANKVVRNSDGTPVLDNNGKCLSADDRVETVDFDLRQTRFDSYVVCDNSGLGNPCNNDKDFKVGNVQTLFTISLDNPGCFVRVESDNGAASTSEPLLSNSLCKRVKTW